MHTPTAPSPARIDQALLQARLAQAERYVEQSQDGAAIRAWAGLKREPAGILERLKAAAVHNQTLRLALGICFGIIAAEAIMGLVRGPALEQARSAVDTWFSGFAPSADGDSLADKTQTLQEVAAEFARGVDVAPAISSGALDVIANADEALLDTMLDLPDLDLDDLLS